MPGAVAVAVAVAFAFTFAVIGRAMAAGGGPAAAAGPWRAYAMTTETGMPHLEANLRYAVVRERRCLDPQDPGAVFWMLGHESLQGCRLERSPATAPEPAGVVAAPASAASMRYDLVCSGGHGTTGSAVWDLAPEALRGTLQVRLGGKNMTFYQRIVARPTGGDCAPP